MRKIKLKQANVLKIVPLLKQTKAKMDCPICFDTINASTGSTTTSCGHTFHFRCLAHWSIQKIQAADHQNCPLCRHEMVESERLPEPVEDEDEDDDEEDNDDYTDRDEDEQDEAYLQFEIDNEEAARRAEAGIPEFDEAAHALWVMRTTFERLDDGESIDSGEAPVINQKDPVNREWVNLGLGIGGLVLANSPFQWSPRQRSISM